MSKIVRRITSAIERGLDEKAYQIIKTYGRYLSKRNYASIVLAVNKSNMCLSYSIVKHIYSESAYRNVLDPGINNSCILRTACRTNNVDMVRFLLEDGRADPSAMQNKSIMLACWYGNVDVLRLLLDDGRADPCTNKGHALVTACKNGHIEIVRVLLEDPRVRADKYLYLDKPIRFAIYNHQTDAVLLLLKYGADPSADRNITLRTASRSGNTALVRMLLEQRIDSTDGFSEAVTEACNNNHPDVVLLLLEDDRTIAKPYSLIDVCRLGSTDIVGLLLNWGLDPASFSNLPIITASKNGHIEVVRLLLGYPSVIEAGLVDAISEAANAEIRDLIMSVDH